MDDTIQKLVNARRMALNGSDDGGRPWGLALSGGGIRSATFCLGLLKALASRRQLLRFDLISTVSGGGYIGAALGRLCTNAGSADEVREIERTLGDVDRSRFGWWLRANGRYLIPGGMRDTLFATALYLRNLLGTHVEIAIAASLIGMVLAATNLLLWDAVFRAVDLDGAQADVALAGAELTSTQALLAIVQWATQVPTLWFTWIGPFIASLVLACAYWSVRDKPSPSSMFLQVGMWCALGAGACWVGPQLVHHYSGPQWLAPAFVGFALCWIVALLWGLWRGRQRNASQLRNELTDALASVLNTALLIGLLGLLDRSAWWLAADNQQQRISYGAVLLVAAAALRGVLPTLLSQKGQAPGIGKTVLLTLASLLGLVLAFCLAAWWIGVVYAAVLLQVFTPEGLDFSRGWVWLGTIGVIVGSYALVTGRNFAFLNISSLHMFYRARIVRGYLGAANARRLGASPTDEISGLEPPQVPVGEVDAHDDIAQLHYAPHLHGGPVHLVNVCINQTHDSKERLFNRDRKGLPLTIGPLGWMQAGGGAWLQARAKAALTLGAWTAISGAAIAPGLGRVTKRGISALSVFAGLRLGYWWDSADAGMVQRGAAARGSTLLMKTRFLLLECFGAFPGSSSANWYLSDGGHFENTGAYALLRQQAALIVIADCGADPDYRFCDLEILIRRARIDLNAEITFMKPQPDAEWSHREAFGSLNDLASPSSQACLAMANVRYASGATGQIVLVKPNVSAALPVDLVNFKAANPLFPQQPTTDQFFDEAQWESYFQLGAEIGHRLKGELLDQVAAGAQGLFVPDDGQSLPVDDADAPRTAGERSDGAAAAAVGKMSRLQARVIKAGAVTASVGLGTAATFGVAAWQGIDNWRSQQAATEQSENTAFKDLSNVWAHLPAGTSASEAPSLLAAELLRTGDLLCREGSDNFMAKFRLSVQIVDDAKRACAKEAPQQRTPACARLLDAGNGIDCLQPTRAPACAPRYWARDYSGQTASKENCSGTAPTPWPAVVWLRDVVTGGPAVQVAAAPPPVEAPAPSAMRGIEPGQVGAASGEAGATPPEAGGAPVPAADVCRGVVVYIQLYGPALRDAARALREPWHALGASVPPVEDVLRTSRQAGRSPPTGHPQPSVIIRDESQRACAQALVQTAASPTGQPWTIKLLPRSLKGAADAIEVWLPRARDTYGN
ncbi:patatin-like phospholipase family protein [Variovorax sp. PBL-E5]|uniref:patatin-like phospholipase family protein n=1 Tax=Variovorax sp. PBL-E5 TaxID=434014 RepID=UPI001317F962|nr:patatin-like phospholipase family protein [Variovorax sp. PBL-E5]VTU31130.1 Patatin-like phospholipase [Variovorax sp. PBL-E5]